MAVIYAYGNVVDADVAPDTFADAFIEVDIPAVYNRIATEGDVSGNVFSAVERAVTVGEELENAGKGCAVFGVEFLYT